jgi:hypothetical protein
MIRLEEALDSIGVNVSDTKPDTRIATPMVTRTRGTACR